MLCDVTIDGRSFRVELGQANGGWQCRLDGREVQMDAVLSQPDVLSLLIDGQSYEIKRERTGAGGDLWLGGTCYSVELRDPRSLRSRRSSPGASTGPMEVIAPMPGKVVRVLLGEKAPVEAGQGVVVVEAMKMQNEIKSPKKGILRKLLAAEGSNVNAGDVLAIVE
jgi:acetyl/propionyl-CoA carboxylase alpha subunit